MEAIQKLHKMKGSRISNSVEHLQGHDQAPELSCNKELNLHIFNLILILSALSFNFKTNLN